MYKLMVWNDNQKESRRIAFMSDYSVARMVIEQIGNDPLNKGEGVYYYLVDMQNLEAYNIE